MKAHLFDADGVIFDSERAHARSYVAYAQREGVSLTEERFLTELRGRNGVAIMRALFPEASEDKLAERTEAVNALFRAEYLDDVTLIRGFEAYLAALREAGHRVVIVSNGVRANLHAMLTAFSIELPSLSIEDFQAPKPDPAGYLAGLALLNATPEQGVVYEDTAIGVLAGKRAGIRVVGVASFLTEDELTAAGADAVIRDFTAFQIR